MLNPYSRAEEAVKIVKNPMALNILLELYPDKKFNAVTIANQLKSDFTEVKKMFQYLDEIGLIKDNPTSGNKVLTGEGKLLLEQTAIIFPNLKQLLEEQKHTSV
ncbi:hypothetical protein HYU12_00875 [Candidatus Woesearchaeota archaeon]|nr:hypothetical protein [Candidatus Woesearchaeota archaeon]